MAANSTLLCVHRDPVQLSLLQENGYELVTATNGHDGLRLLMSRPVDAVVIECHLSLLDGAVVADEIKQVRPTVPVVMLSDNLDLPDGALKSVDALVIKSDGVHFLWATVHFMLDARQNPRRKGTLRAQTPTHLRRLGKPWVARSQVNAPRSAIDDKNAPFSPGTWRGIRNGSIRF